MNRSPIRSSMAAVRDHSRNFSDYYYVYPVISRRARGLSIGVNLNPDKVCNFNCIYCEVDRRTPPRTMGLDVVRLRAELAALLHYVKTGGLSGLGKFSDAPALTEEIKDIAFSGDGEPTMIPNFAECVQVVAEEKRAAALEKTKIVLITDAAGLDKADVKKGLEIMDANNGEIWGKLDAGTAAYYQLVNRTTVQFERILKNLLETAKIRPIIIQSLFLRVHGERMPAAELQAYCARLRELVQSGAKIKAVQAYTVARPTPESFASKLDAETLEEIAVVIRQQTGLTVWVFE